MAKKKSGAARTQVEAKAIPLKWKPVEDLPTVYANHFAISHGGGEDFFIVFAEIAPPTAALQAERPSSIQVTPVAKIAMSPGNMFRFLSALQTNVDAYHARKSSK